MPSAPAGERTSWIRISTVSLVATVVVLAFLFQMALTFNHDVAWCFTVARGTLRGGVLYRDFIEPVNLPLASLSLVPAVLISEYGGFSPHAAVVVYVLAIILLCFWLTLAVSRELQLTRAQDLRWRALLIVGCCFIPGYEFGQREHLIAVLILPYLVAAAIRSSGRSIPTGLALLVGVAVGMAVGIKPLAALIIFTVEIAIQLRRWHLRDLFRTEILIAMIVVTAVIADLFAFHWRYFEVLCWALALYGGYQDPFTVVSRGVLFGLLYWIILWSRISPPPGSMLAALQWVLTFAAAGATAAFVLQMKGWYYHALPLVICIFLLAGLSLLQDSQRTSLGRPSPYFVLFAIIANAAVGAISPFPVNASTLAALEYRIADSPGSFFFFSTHVWPGFPLAVSTGHEWASRYPCLVWLPGLLAASPEISARWGSIYRATVAQDFARHRPTLVFIPAVDQRFPAGFDVLKWFQQDDGFRSQWESYRPAGSIDGIAVFERS